MSEKERNKKMEEMELELVKARVGAKKGEGSSKVKEIKKIIARIHTINALNSKKELKKTK